MPVYQTMDEQPKPTIKIPGLMNPFDVVTSHIDPIHDMGTQLRAFLEDDYPLFEKKKSPPQVRIDFEGYFDIGFPPSFPPVYMGQFQEGDEGHQEWIAFFNKYSVLNPLTCNDKLFYEREFGDRLADRGDFNDLFGIDHGYYDSNNPIFYDDCDYAMTSKCLIEFDEITDLDEGLDILRRLCSEHNVNIDEDEQISLSDIKINAYALHSDSRTYTIEVNVYTTLEADEDFDKVKYLDGLIEARNRVVDTSFQYRVGNIIKLPFYFVIADKDKSRIHYRHYPTPCVVWPDYVDENKFASVFFQNQFSKSDEVVISRSEPEYGCNPAWNRRYIMLEDKLQTALEDNAKYITKVRESFSKKILAASINGHDSIDIPEMSEYFDWPNTDVEPTWHGVSELDTSDWPRIGVLKTLGYHVSEKNPLLTENRSKILDYVFSNSKLPFVKSYDHMLGWGPASSSSRLKKLANSLAAFGRREHKRGNKSPLSKYDEDLDYLKEKYYQPMFPNDWVWPSTDTY
jgi:hypothetical protein